MNQQWNSCKVQLNYRLLFIILVTLIEVVLNIGRYWPDSTLWIKLSEELHKAFHTGSLNLQGMPVTYSMRPMVPFLAGFLSPFLGPALSFGLINGLFWIGGAILAYKVMMLATSNRNMAFSAALLFTTSVPMVAYGSSILSDSPEYFFVGLALYLVLLRRLKDGRKGESFLDLTAVGIGILFHLAIFPAFIFMAIKYLLDRRRRYESLFAIILIGFTYFIIAYMMGWIEQIYNFMFMLFKDPLSQRGGPPFLDAFIWTFGITAPLYPFLIIPSRFIAYLTNAMFFLIMLGLGSFRIPRKVEIFMYLPFLLVIIHIQHINIERYLFILWPVIIPILICGLYYASDNILKILKKALRRKGVYSAMILNSNLLVNAYIFLQGFYNTLAMIRLLGLSPLLSI